MNLLSDKPIGVVGAGSFGSAVSNIISERRDVLLYVRSDEALSRARQTRMIRGHLLGERVSFTNDLAEVTSRCDVIFPIVPSSHFRAMMRQMAPLLRPYHILIHGAKGFDILLHEGETIERVKTLNRAQVKTMSEVIREESVAVRVGCLAGPNISRELAQRQPSATVVASSFEEVIKVGKLLLRNDWFQVYENDDIIGIEMAGVLKNIIAIAAGALAGLGYGENSKGFLISRGAVEMIYLGKALGANVKAFLGLAGIGDLVTTCNSPMSRNFKVGYQLAQGQPIDTIIGQMQEVAEGVRTICVAKKCADFYKVHAPITNQLYKVLFEGTNIHKSVEYLMRYPFDADIDFLEETPPRLPRGRRSESSYLADEDGF